MARISQSGGCFSLYREHGIWRHLHLPCFASVAVAPLSNSHWWHFPCHRMGMAVVDLEEVTGMEQKSSGESVLVFLYSCLWWETGELQLTLEQCRVVSGVQLLHSGKSWCNCICLCTRGYPTRGLTLEQLKFKLRGVNWKISAYKWTCGVQVHVV